MADTSIAVTAGSGTSIDTRTEATNGNHRQVIVIGDPSTNAGVAPVDANTGLKVDLGSDNDVTVTSGNITVSGTVTANLSTTDNNVLDAIEADTTTLAGAVAGTEMQVDVVGALPAGSNAIGKLAANTGVTIGAVEIASAQTLATVTTVGSVSTLTGGGVAHDSADSGNPVKVGAKAAATLSTATLVAAADRTDMIGDLDGALIVRGNYALGDLVNGNASNTDGTSTSVLASGGAGVKHYITDVTITNTSASNIYVELKDNTTVKWTFPVPANGGVTHHFASPLAGTAATAWNFDPSAAATTVYCSVSGFKSKI
jgi:hypothetical protein